MRPGPSAYLRGPHDADFLRDRRERAYTATASGYHMVGTGHTQAEANRDLWEKIRQAGET